MASLEPVVTSGTELLADGEITVLGRIMPASNQTYLCRLGDEDSDVRAVYKPTAGEQPLWDFEDGTLAHREYAAYLVSEALGWSVVPPTLVRDGPAGPGMVQLWCEPDPDLNAVDIIAQGAEAPGFLRVLDAHDHQDRPVTLVHEDTLALRRMAIFDLVVNNTDRKGGHVLAMASGHRFGVDHGVCFHVDDKLRTVLWGWAGQELTPDEVEGISVLRELLDHELAASLASLLTEQEIRRTRLRVDRLLRTATFPEPGDGWPPLPWPAF